MAAAETPREKWARITTEMDRDMRSEGEQRARSGPNWKMFTPILWAPVFPSIRIALRNRPVARTRAFVAAVALANVHGFWLVMDPGGELFE